MRKITLILFLIVFSNCRGQENTLQLTEGSTSPQAALEDVAWIQGHWKGEAFGGITEEIWSPPLGDSMMFSFKLVTDDKVVFYELGGIRKINGSLIFQLKHFGNDFKGWEEKDETLDARLVKIEGDRVYFEGFTFEKVNETELAIYVLIEEKDKTEEVKFNYYRQ